MTQGENSGRNPMDFGTAFSSSIEDIKSRLRDVESRVRTIEVEEMDKVRRCIYSLENAVSNFKTANDSRREKWNMFLNFMVQLIWVIMAAYMLTKLGLGMGPL